MEPYFILMPYFSSAVEIKPSLTAVSCFSKEKDRGLNIISETAAIIKNIIISVMRLFLIFSTERLLYQKKKCYDSRYGII